jgi:predicted metal-dependent peptidase
MKKQLNNINSSFDTAMIKLIQNEPYYANFLLGMNKSFITKLPDGRPLATAGVCVQEQINLVVNPYFWLSLSLLEQVDLLKHEVLHVLGNHITRYKDLEPNLFKKENKTLSDVIEDMTNANELNQAADYAINEFLPNCSKNFNMFDEKGGKLLYPEGHEEAGKPIVTSGLFVKDLQKVMPKVEKLKNMEYYYELLKQNRPQKGNGKGQGGQGEGGSLIDDHGVWDLSNSDSEYIKEKIKVAANKALEQTKEKNAGNIPGNILEAIEKLNHKPRDWKAELRNFIAHTAETVTESTRKRRNRRYGLLYPGTRTFPKLSLAILVDTSGSVYNELLNQAFAEVAKIHSCDTRIVVVEGDTQVNQVYEFNPKKPIKVVGRGGTLFKPLFDKAEELDVDGIIFFTDGENFDGEAVKKPKVPMLWGLYEGCRSHYDWGRKIEIKIQKRIK